jgi:hypothetical protein
MSSEAAQLLPGGIERPFAEIAAALATGRDPGLRSTPPRTLAATIVAVCAPQRLSEAAEALLRLGKHTAVRAILISEGGETRPKAFVAEDAIAVPGLKAPFVNNAVAALRLSSLPTLVWWRGCSPEVLEDLANLADRLVMDDQDPLSIWKRAVDLFDRAAFSDIRWARLTRWRALMAMFFDIPEVRAASSRFDRLLIKGADPAAASLFANWLAGSLRRDGAIEVHFEQGSQSVFLEQVTLAARQDELTLTLAGSGTCVLASSIVQGHRGVSRTVSLGDQSDRALIAGELQIRVRDPAFERAVRAYVAATNVGN